MPREPTMTRILGIHHVTAIAGDPQRNLDFYARTLGLRFVKLTVNFDDPGTYHFYFADATGSPGSIMTFFPWPRGRGGRHGSGQVAVTQFSIAPGAVGFWIERFLRLGVAYQGPTKRGSGASAETVIAFRDPDGVMLELVGHPAADQGGSDAVHRFRDTAGVTKGRQVSGWDGAGVAPAEAIRGFHGVTLWVDRGDATAKVLRDTLGFREVHEEDSTKRFAAGSGGPGTIVDVRSVGGFGRGADGVGVVHHVAFAVDDDATQQAVRQQVIADGLHPTPVVDRNYFHSVYFREPGGVLYEIATVPPGFAVDEPVEQLGRKLMLPGQHESRRAELENSLPPVVLP